MVEEQAVDGLARDSTVRREDRWEREGNLNLNLDEEKVEVEEKGEELEVADELIILYGRLQMSGSDSPHCRKGFIFLEGKGW